MPGSSHVAILAVAIAHVAWRAHKIAVRTASSNHDLSLLSASDGCLLSNSNLCGRPLYGRDDRASAGRPAVTLVVLEAELVLLIDVLHAAGRPLCEGILAACNQARLIARGHLQVRRRPLQVNDALIICS